MVQRVIRQLGESDLKGHVTVATSLSQADVIYNPLVEYIDVVLEPDSTDNFPAIALAASHHPAHIAIHPIPDEGGVCKSEPTKVYCD